MVVVLIDHKIVFAWFPVLVNRLRIVSIGLALIVTMFRLMSIDKEIPPSVSGVDSSRDCVVPIDSQENLSCTWIDTCSRKCYGVGVYFKQRY